jgi:hypothetical protein
MGQVIEIAAVYSVEYERDYLLLSFVEPSAKPGDAPSLTFRMKSSEASKLANRIRDQIFIGRVARRGAQPSTRRA